MFVDLSQPWLRRWEVGIGLAAYRMDDVAGWSPIHQLVSDSVLRAVHRNLLHEDSLPVVSGTLDDRLIFSLTDLAGRRLALREKHAYALPVRIDLTRYVRLRSTERSTMGLNLAMHASYPLEGDLGAGEVALSRGMDFGIAANFIHSRRVTANVSSTYHVQVARFRSDVHVVNPNSPLNGDDATRSQYALTYGLRFANTFGGRAPCSFSMSQVTNSAHYDKETYYTWDPLVFAGGDNLRGAIAAANDYGVLSYACEFRGRQFQVALIEDIGGLSQLVDDDGAGTSYDPDFAVSVSVSWVLGERRSGRPD